jgi:hypothetical protein
MTSSPVSAVVGALVPIAPLSPDELTECASR